MSESGYQPDYSENSSILTVCSSNGTIKFTYIFVVWSTSSGDLIAEGMNTTLPINNASNYLDEVNYTSICAAYQNEVLYDRERNNKMSLIEVRDLS